MTTTYYTTADVIEASGMSERMIDFYIRRRRIGPDLPPIRTSDGRAVRRSYRHPGPGHRRRWSQAKFDADVEWLRARQEWKAAQP